MMLAILFGIITLITGYLILVLKNTWFKAIGYPIFVLSFIFTWQQSLGIALPSDFNLLHIKGKLIAQRLVEPTAIYVWIMPDQQTQPLAIQLPWEKSTARQLHEAEQKKQGLVMEVPSAAERIMGKLKASIEGEDTGKPTTGGKPDTSANPANTETPPKPDQDQSSHGTGTKALHLDTSRPIFYPDMNLPSLPPKATAGEP